MMEVDIVLDFKAKIRPLKPTSVDEEIRLTQAEVYLNYRLSLLKDALEKEFKRMWDNQDPKLQGKL